MSYATIKARWDADPTAPSLSDTEAHRLYAWCRLITDLMDEAR